MKNELKLGPGLSADEIRRLQEIEGNPFSPEDEEMFAMFDREGWDHEQRAAYIRKKFNAEPVPNAAE